MLPDKEVLGCFSQAWWYGILPQGCMCDSDVLCQAFGQSAIRRANL